MLIQCPECNKDVSDSAPSCPNCGYTLKSTILDETSKGPASIPHKKIATFQFIALGAIVIALFTPRILVSLPCLVIISAGIIALVRKEPRRILSVASILIGFYFIIALSSIFVGGTRYINNMQIQNWDVVLSDSSGNYSYIRGRIKNVGDETVSYFKIKALYEDDSGNVLDTDYTNSVESMLPGMSKEFEIMHKNSDTYKKFAIIIEEVRTK